MTQQPVGPPAGAGGPTPTWDVARPAEAGLLSQGITVLTVGLALLLTTSVADAAHAGVWAALVLAASAGVGITTGAHRAFRSFPGLVAAITVFLALLFLGSLLLPNLPERWGLVLLCAPLVPVGLDWRRVGRLQATVAVAAFLLIPVTSADRSGALALTLGWFALAAASLWSLEQDRRRSEDRPVPLVPGATDGEPHPGDLVRTVALAVGVGLVAALLLSVPSCDLDLDLDLPGTGSSGSVQVEPGEPGDPGSGRPSSGEPGSGGPGTGDPGGSPSTGTGDRDGDQTSERPSPPRFSPWWLLALVALAAAIAWYWWQRSRPPETATPDREWALALVEQLDDAARARGRPRPDSSTVRQHADELADSVLPDERLRAVGRLLNDALFGRAAIDAHTRLWAQAVVDEILEAHPVERRSRR